MPKTTHHPSPPPSLEKRNRASVLLKRSSPPKLQTAARSKDRLAKADVFSEHAERARKEKAMQLEAFKRQKHEAEIARSNNSKPVSTPSHPFSFGGQKRWEESQLKLEEKRSEEEKERKLMTVSFRARDYKFKSPSPPTKANSNKRRITIADPFELRSSTRHEAYQAKLNQRLQEEKEKEKEDELKLQEFHSRPVPQTTYKHVPISSFQAKSESMRRFEQLHKQKVEERKKLEKEKEAEFHSRPVPKTTYESKPITDSAREEEALRRAEELKEIKLEEQRKREEEKSREEAEFHYKPRPAPPTTYEPKPISPELEKKAMEDAALTREKKLEELKKMEHEDGNAEAFRSRPVPPTTYKSPSFSPRYEDSLRNIKATGQQKLDELKKKEVEKREKEEAEFHYKSRPLPSTTYSPKRISTRETLSEQKRQRAAPASRSEESSFRARPLPKTTYKPEMVPHMTSPRDTSSVMSPSISTHTMSKASNHPGQDGEHVFTFHARPLPKSTHKPQYVSPMRSTKKSPMRSTKKQDGPEKKGGETPSRQYHRDSEHKSPMFRARPVPVTTYQPSALSPKPRPTPVKASTNTLKASKNESGSLNSSREEFHLSVKTPKKNAVDHKSGDSEKKTFRARPVPKSTYHSPQRQSTFRPITRPKVSPKISKSGTLSSPKAASTPKPQRATASTSISVTPSTKSLTKMEMTPSAEDSALAAILDDDQAAEITFSPAENDDDDTNTRDDPELTAILKSVDPWTATGNHENQDSVDGELDAILDS